MPKKEIGSSNANEAMLESRAVKPPTAPTNSKDQLITVKKYASVLDETIDNVGEELGGEEFDSMVELETRRDEADQGIEEAKKLLDREARKCAQFMLAEWPDDAQVEQAQSELKQIEVELKTIEGRLKQLNRSPDKNSPDFESIKGITKELENKKQILSDWEARHKATAPKAKELKKLMAESEQMGILRRTFSGINGKIAELKQSSIDGPIKDSENEEETIARLKKGVKELTSKLGAIQDEASRLEIQKKELTENREMIAKPLEQTNARSQELVAYIQKVKDIPGASDDSKYAKSALADDLKYNKSLLTKYLETK